MPARRRQASPLARVRLVPWPPASFPRTSPSLLRYWRAWPGQKKKAVQKVQAPAQPFIAFDPARPAEDQSARRARRVFSCPPPDLYDRAPPAVRRMI